MADDIKDTDDEVCETAPCGGDETPEEPNGGSVSFEEYSALKEHMNALEKQISGISASIATIIDAGGTIMEPANPCADEDEDCDEPFLYLEDLDYRI